MSIIIVNYNLMYKNDISEETKLSELKMVLKIIKFI